MSNRKHKEERVSVVSATYKYNLGTILVFGDHVKHSSLYSSGDALSRMHSLVTSFASC